MVNVNNHTRYYWTKFNQKVEQFNKPGKLPDYFGEMIGDKKKVKIAEMACGLVNTIGDSWPGVEVELICSDAHAKSFRSMWEEKGIEPLHNIHKQDMEELTYPAGVFDIVHCRNAMDHTEDPLRAIEELKRVSNEWVYLLHAPDQMERFGGHHFWNIRLEDGKTVFYGKEYSFILNGFESYSDEDGLIVSKFKHEV